MLGDAGAAAASSSAMGRLYRRHFGTPDLHSHFRTAPLFEHFRSVARQNAPLRVLELGCGTGDNLVELSKIVSLQAEGYEVDRTAVQSGSAALRALDMQRQILLRCLDATSLPNTSEKWDVVLAMDFLEHLGNPSEIVAWAADRMKSGGTFYASVPTRLYPLVFGYRFHEALGHRTDGYSLEELDSLFPSGKWRRVQHKYNTGPVAAAGCALFYRVLGRLPTKSLRALLALPLQPLRAADVFNGRRTSSSLFAVYVRT